jgi:putative tryptophan/tyrosine transport system substrate-binding protein
MRRREFIAALGSAAAWPVIARAQQDGRVRRIGVLMSFAESGPEGQACAVALRQGLAALGWIEERNLRIDYRWYPGDGDGHRAYAEELAALAPDLILAGGSAAARLVLRITRTLPVVFVGVSDPVGSGYVASLARPGGNATGFTSLEFATSAKLPELLKEIAPRVTRAAVIVDRNAISGQLVFPVIEAAASSYGMEVTQVDARNAGEIERSVTAFATAPNGGLIVAGSALAVFQRDLIIALAARLKLPAVYFQSSFVISGGLISYAPDMVEGYRHAAGYVDRILKGEKPADLPVQNPTKYQTALNMKTAKALDLEVPATVLVRADEVIE